MQYDARQIANWFVRRFSEQGRRLTIMQVLKLVYISHGWFLETRGKPLFGNQIEAWKYGPVIPDAYNAFRSQGISIQAELDGFEASALDQATVSLLSEIDKIYGHMTASELSDITHVQGGPWDIATKKGHYAKIDDEVIKAHYQAKRAAAYQARETA